MSAPAQRGIRIACTPCHRKKITCNKELPCERCTRMSLTCDARYSDRYKACPTAAQSMPPEAGTAVSLSTTQSHSATPANDERATSISSVGRGENLPEAPAEELGPRPNKRKLVELRDLLNGESQNTYQYSGLTNHSCPQQMRRVHPSSHRESITTLGTHGSIVSGIPVQYSTDISKCRHPKCSNLYMMENG